MEPRVSGSRATLEVVGKHWLIDGAHRLKCGVLATPHPSRNKKYSCEVNSVFVGLWKKKPIKDFVRSVRNCDLAILRPSDMGLYAVIECKGSRSLEYHTSRWPGRVGMYANPDDEKIMLTVDSPVTLELGQFAKELKTLTDVKPDREPKLEKANVPVSDFVDLEPILAEDISEEDRCIAEVLLKSGWYNVPRPEGLTLEVLGEELDLSKPSLIMKIRRLDALGIKKLLGTEVLSQEDRQAAYTVFRRTLGKR